MIKPKIISVHGNTLTIAFDNNGIENTIDLEFAFPEEVRKSGKDGKYVYALIIKDEIYYIGKGSRSRWEHTKDISKTDNIFIESALRRGRANKNTSETIIIAYGLKEGSALQKERDLIRKLKPIGNIESNPRYLSKGGEVRLTESLTTYCDMIVDKAWERAEKTIRIIRGHEKKIPTQIKRCVKIETRQVVREERRKARRKSKKKRKNKVKVPWKTTTKIKGLWKDNKLRGFWKE